MRIDTTPINEASQVQAGQGAKEQPPLREGQVVQAAVVEQKGEQVLLRMENGRLLQARLAANLELHMFDHVECMVQKGEEGGLKLQLLSILHGAPREAGNAAKGQSLLLSLGLAGDANANALLSVMDEMGVTPSKPLLLSALQLMRETPLAAKGAVFFAANQIDPAPEAVAAFSAMREGATPGATLYQAAREVNSLEAGVQTLEGGARENEQIAPQAAQEQPKEAGGAQKSGQPAQVIKEPPVQTVGEKPAAQASGEKPAAAPPRSNEAARTPEREAAKQAAPARGQAAFHRESAEAPERQKPETGALARRILNMFLELDEKMDGGRVKKAAADTAGQPALLREMAETGQPRGAAVAQKMNDAAAQIRLTQDVQRFICLHIPVHHNGYDTAELYIYKDKKKKRIDPGNTAILIGLETKNMGRVETLIRVEGRNISLAFRVEAENAVPLIKERARELYHSFKEYRYTLIDTKASALYDRTRLDGVEQALGAALSKPKTVVDCRI